MNKDHLHDIVIIGGGLAGLSLAIQASRAGYNTILFEKEKYPFHRVCGEYISLESWNFLEELGIPLSDMHLPQIQELLISAPNGNFLRHHLSLGGFGISRYLLDHSLSKLARASGAVIMEQTKVSNVQFLNDNFFISTTNGNFHTKIAVGAFGKRSNLDVKWKRPFIQQKPDKLNNYIAVKYHLQYPIHKHEIALHNFENGYAGISQIEDNLQCLCYLTTSENLRKNENDVRKMEERILMKNPFLQDIFSKAVFKFNQPVIISQVAFSSKSQIENHVLLMGDAAGMITPLCGNGMSMAFHSSKLAFKEIEKFLLHKSDRFAMERRYSNQWKYFFAGRLRSGRAIQYFFGNPLITNFFISTVKRFPKMVEYLVKQTHGTPF